MAHLVESMFFVCDMPWHGLGVRVEEALSSKEALKVSGVDWEVVQKPILTSDLMYVPGYKVNIRSTDQLGAACVNLSNLATIEFRMFRGTLKLQTFKATLQMVDEICNVAISMSNDEMKNLSWQEFVLGINKNCKIELIEYLIKQ